MTRRITAAMTWCIVFTMSVVLHENHRKHWWWDNVAHFLGGFGLGLILPEDRERATFLGIAVAWEAFEWGLARLKLYERHDSFPEGPRSLGYEAWDFDHQVEDTLLDTVMGYYGVKTAKRLKAYL